MSFITEPIKHDLTQMYSAPGRFYHDMSHVEALLALLEQYRNEFADPYVVEAAIWFHDCIYDAKAKDNEDQSAELAVAHLKPTCTTESDEKRLGLIRDMIEATKTHAIPAFPDADAVADTSLFLDMDMSILGSDQDTFDKYEADVRKEYSFVSDEGWRTGRAAVLANFASRPRIFYSDLFRDKYEAKARENIARSLEKLRG